MSNKINDLRAIRILIANTFFRGGRYITTIFVNIYILSVTGDVKIMALYNIIYLLAHYSVFLILGPIVKNNYRKTVFISALIGQILGYAILIVYGEFIINYYYIFAVGTGLSSGAYWVVFNNNEFDLTKQKNRGNFQGLKKAMKNTMMIIVPGLIGFIIAADWFSLGYEIAFFIGILLNALALVFGLVKMEYHSGSHYKLIPAVRSFIAVSDIRLFYLNTFIIGFILSPMLIGNILPLMIYAQGVSINNVGYAVAFFGFFTIIGSYIIGKFLCYSHYKRLYSGIIITYILAIIVLLIFQNTTTLILFSSLVTLLVTLISIPCYVYRAALLESVANHKNIKGEYMVFSEFFLCFGGILSYVLLYFLGDLSIESIYIYFISVIAASMISLIIFNNIKLDLQK